MAIFNAPAFFKACNNDKSIALPAFMAAFGMPAHRHVDGEALLALIEKQDIKQAFDSGEFITVVDHCTNKVDYSYDLVIKINNQGQAMVKEGGSCGANDHACTAYKALESYEQHFDTKNWLHNGLWLGQAMTS